MFKTSQLRIAVLMLFLIFTIGTIGYHVIEGWGVIDSLYTTVVTLSTVGYGDFYPHTWQGRLFTVFLIIIGVGTVLYTAGLVAETFIEGRMRMLMGRGKLEKVIEKMHDHYIICGCGRIGYLICRELKAEHVDFVVVDNSPEAIQKIEDEGYVFYRGDATLDRTLVEAGIRRARGIVCALPTDAENLYIILTARELNQGIYILSRSEEEESEHRLLRAGANRVMSPYTLGGMRMAMAILRPAMLDFIEITTNRQSLELRMEEIAICEGSPVIGKTLGDSDVRQRFGLIIVAVKKESGRMIFNPLATYQIEKGDMLIALGEEDNVQQFSRVCID